MYKTIPKTRNINQLNSALPQVAIAWPLHHFGLWQWYSPVLWLVWQPLESVPPLWPIAKPATDINAAPMMETNTFFMVFSRNKVLPDR